MPYQHIHTKIHCERPILFQKYQYLNLKYKRSCVEDINFFYSDENIKFHKYHVKGKKLPVHNFFHR